MQINTESDIGPAVQNMIDSLTEILEYAEEKAREAVQQSLFDLRAAAKYKGESYEAIRKANHLQPLCGYYTHWEDTAQRRKPRWTREQVEQWARVTKPQRGDYIESLLYGDDSEIAAGVLHMLINDIEKDRLPEYLRDTVDEYAETVKGRAV